MRSLKEFEGLYVEVYKNLHRNCWSVRHRGIVIHHVTYITLRDPRFVVQPAGNAKVRRDKRKTVHAMVRGYIHFPEGNDWKVHDPKDRFTYDPYKHTSFVMVETGEPVYMGTMAHMYLNGCYVDRNDRN